jgi:quinolinate synthase
LDEAPVQAVGESCSLDHYLVQPDESMDERIAAAKRKLGGQAIVLGHHYQRDEVIRFADFTGDSYKLSKAAQTRTRATWSSAACTSWQRPPMFSPRPASR